MPGRLKTYSDEIASAAAIIGILVGVVGFGLTYCQLRSTSQALQAANSYQIQKDAREIIDGVAGDPKFVAFIKGAQEPADKDHIHGQLWKMMNFYLSVFRQSEANGLPSDFTTSFKADFCGFVARPPVALAVAEMTADGQLSQNHTKMRESWCDGK